MTENREKEETPLRQRFKSGGRAVNSYANARGISRHSLSKVLDGVYTGQRNDKHVRKVIEALADDGIWTAPLPWDNQEAS